MALTQAIQRLYCLSLSGSRRRFERAARQCETAQMQKLRQVVRDNADAAYGRAHRFASITSVREWQDRVPLVDYQDLRPWVLRAADGEPCVLTAAKVVVFERTSGSTAAEKLVPYTRGLLAEFGAATAPWLHDLYTTLPQLKGTRSYWSISPVTRAGEVTPGGIPIGFADDTEYFGRVARLALRRTLAVPPEVARLQDVGAWSQATIRHLVAAADLGLVSVWHPSFFVSLMRAIERQLPEVLPELPSARREEIERRVRSSSIAERLWPKLALVSCWGDGPAADALSSLRAQVPHARIQPKGLLATEGVVSFPLFCNGGSDNVAAVASHFFEFVDVDRQRQHPLLAHQLRPGASYVPVISTSGGFYRYRLGDVVRCTGFHLQAPLLRFEGRIDQVSDLRGEKLNAHMVTAKLQEAQQAHGVALTFAMVVPVRSEPPHYTLFAEGATIDALAALARSLEHAFHENPGYRYARMLGQLGPVEAAVVRDGAVQYLQARIAAGQRAGDVKPVHLDARGDALSAFLAAYPEADEVVRG